MNQIVQFLTFVWESNILFAIGFITLLFVALYQTGVGSPYRSQPQRKKKDLHPTEYGSNQNEAGFTNNHKRRIKIEIKPIGFVFFFLFGLIFFGVVYLLLGLLFNSTLPMGSPGLCIPTFFVVWGVIAILHLIKLPLIGAIHAINRQFPYFKTMNLRLLNKVYIANYGTWIITYGSPEMKLRFVSPLQDLFLFLGPPNASNDPQDPKAYVMLEWLIKLRLSQKGLPVFIATGKKLDEKLAKLSSVFWENKDWLIEFFREKNYTQNRVLLNNFILEQQSSIDGISPTIWRIEQ